MIIHRTIVRVKRKFKKIEYGAIEKPAAPVLDYVMLA